MTQPTDSTPKPDDAEPTSEPGPYKIPVRRANNFGKNPFFDSPVDQTPAGPSDEDLERARNAQVGGRLADIHAATHKRVTTAIEHHGSAIADVRSCSARFALAQHKLRVAELENKTVLALPPAQGASRYDSYHRAVGGFVMTVVLMVCVIGDYLVDRGSLLVFRLPLAFTETLALLIAVVQTLSAHTVGKLLRRLTEAIDRDELWRERRKMRILIGLIILMAVSLAIVRAARGNLIMAALVLGVAGASAVVAVTVSYLHANSRLSARKAVGRELSRTGNKAADHGRDLVMAEAKETSARNALMATAADVVSRIDLVYLNQGITPKQEPAWVLQLRNWAAGQSLPLEDA